MVVGQAFADELLAAFRDLRLGWEDHFTRVENRLIFENRLLAQVVAERFGSEKELKEDDTDAPYVNFV